LICDGSMKQLGDTRNTSEALLVLNLREVDQLLLADCVADLADQPDCDQARYLRRAIRRYLLRQSVEPRPV